jgi:hypothetical protein
MNGVCKTNRRKRKWYKLLVGRPKRKSHYEKHDIGGWIIIRCSFETKDVVDWISVAQDRDQWRAVMNAQMDLRIP